MNALPTATACALPHGQAHGIPRAIQSGSVAGTVHAKRSEVKGPEVKTPDLKGPEVKMNQPWSPSHHGVQKVDASDSATVVAPSPVTTPDAMMSLTAIAHLDFEAEVPCEARPRHPHGRADFIVIGMCPGCGDFKGTDAPRRYGLCFQHWLAYVGRSMRCEKCGHVAAANGGFFRIVQVLR